MATIVTVEVDEKKLTQKVVRQLDKLYVDNFTRDEVAAQMKPLGRIATGIAGRDEPECMLVEWKGELRLISPMYWPLWWAIEFRAYPRLIIL